MPDSRIEHTPIFERSERGYEFDALIAEALGEAERAMTDGSVLMCVGIAGDSAPSFFLDVPVVERIARLGLAATVRVIPAAMANERHHKEAICPRLDTHFQIGGDDVDPVALDDRIGVTASERHIKGMRPGGSGPMTHRTNRWILGTGYERRSDIAVQLEQVLDTLAPHTDAVIAELDRANADAAVHLVAFYVDPLTVSLSREHLATIARLRASVDLDLYRVDSLQPWV